MIPSELQKALFTGVGVVVVSREKARQIADRLVAEAKLSAEDAEKLFEELTESGEDKWTSLKESVRTAARRGLDGLDIARAERIEEMERRLENLENRMAILESMQRREPGSAS
jgi:polyhydroxyalkanoate synthesis regulator phasin